MRSTRLTVLIVGLLTAATGFASPAGQRAHDQNPGAARDSLGPATAPTRLTLSDPDGVRIPFDLRTNHIFMRGGVNGSDSLWIVLDSGASGNVINAALTDRLQLVGTGDGQAQGAGGKVAVKRVAAVTVKLPGVMLEGASLAAINLDAMAVQSGRAMDVIVGQPLLSRCVVRIDYAAGVLTFYDSETFHDSGQGAVLPLSFDRGLPYVTARVSLPGRDPVEGRFVIDTGSSQALLLSAPFVREQHAFEAVSPTIQGRGRGVGGQVQTAIGRLASLEIGGIRLERPIGTLQISEGGLITATGALGNIGGDILRHFTVTLDYPHQRMILEPNARFGEPFEADMAGLGLRMGAQDTRALDVEWIQPGSPAEEAGVKPGDLIEVLDGKPALEVGISTLRELFRHEGDTHRLVIRRGATRLEIAFTTRRLV